jgi:hypothetical protein
MNRGIQTGWNLPRDPIGVYVARIIICKLLFVVVGSVVVFKSPLLRGVHMNPQR